MPPLRFTPPTPAPSPLPAAIPGPPPSRRASTRGRGGQPHYRTVRADPTRNPDAARRYNERGLDRLDAGDLDAAEKAFSQALAADVEFGPAHNNLGKVYFQQRDWYRAAWEFEYARKLMPRRPEPANNLGLVLERAGELDRAVERFREAVNLAPDHVEYKANLARALVRRGDRTREVRTLLEDVVAHDRRAHWITWAQRQLDRRGFTFDR